MGHLGSGDSQLNLAYMSTIHKLKPVLILADKDWGPVYPQIFLSLTCMWWNTFTTAKESSILLKMIRPYWSKQFELLTTGPLFRTTLFKRDFHMMLPQTSLVFHAKFQILPSCKVSYPTFTTCQDSSAALGAGLFLLWEHFSRPCQCWLVAGCVPRCNTPVKY